MIPIFSSLLNYRDAIIHQLKITYLKVALSLSDLATLALSIVYLNHIITSIKTHKCRATC